MPGTRSRVVVAVGFVCLSCAALSFIAAIAFGFVQSSNIIAGETATPSPAELGRGIRFALVAMGAAMILGAVGVAAIVVGLFVRR